MGGDGGDGHAHAHAAVAVPPRLFGSGGRGGRHVVAETERRLKGGARKRAHEHRSEATYKWQAVEDAHAQGGG